MNEFQKFKVNRTTKVAAIKKKGIIVLASKDKKKVPLMINEALTEKEKRNYHAIETKRNTRSCDILLCIGRKYNVD